MTATKDQYDLLVEIRPYKFDGGEVGYRKAEGLERCKNCIHMFSRVTDGYNVCEIYREADPGKEESIEPEWVCDFHTVDGENFPLLKESK